MNIARTIHRTHLERDHLDSQQSHRLHPGRTHWDLLNFYADGSGIKNEIELPAGAPSFEGMRGLHWPLQLLHNLFWRTLRHSPRSRNCHGTLLWAKHLHLRRQSSSTTSRERLRKLLRIIRTPRHSHPAQRGPRRSQDRTPLDSGAH